MSAASLTVEDIRSEKLRREKMRRDAKRSLLSFTEYTKPDYEVNWHHRLLADTLNAWVHGDCKRLIVCMPPRHGKSELVSRRLPAYIFGKYPNSSVIAASYSQDLANAMSRDVQGIMDDGRYIDLFPSSRRPFRSDARRRAVEEWQLGFQQGSYKAAGIGAGITGRGFDFGIIDDPFKDDAQAQSPKVRESVWYWYWSAFFTRQQPDARILITMTRWHQDDLVGRLLDKEGNKWHKIVLPAVKEKEDTHPDDPRDEGEFLWPSRFGEEEAEDVKPIVRVWNAAYRQNPSEGEGNVVKRAWLRRYDHLPPGRAEEYLLSIDASFKATTGSSRVSELLWARYGRTQFYLLDEETRRMGFLDTITAAKSIISRWPEVKGRLTILIEDKANGPAIIEQLGLELPNVVPFTPRDSKPARFRACAPTFKAGNIFVPAIGYMIRGEVDSTRWVQDLIDEWAEFPYHGFNDRVDATSQAVMHFLENSWDLCFGRADHLDDDEVDDENDFELEEDEVLMERSLDLDVPKRHNSRNGRNGRNGAIKWRTPFSKD